MSYPTHLTSPVEAITVRRGTFWVPGDVEQTPAGTVQVGPMHVEWEAAPNAAGAPIVLIHGGGGQGADWKTTPDGRPGWADRLVRAGHPVYVVDRPGHGRSPAHADVVGPVGPQGGYESTAFVFVPRDAGGHAPWPWGREAGDAELDQLVASAGSLPADIAVGQRRDADRLLRLLAEIGPAVLVAHSAGAPAAWLAAMARPDLVSGIVAVEPMGPPFAEIPGIGALAHGLTAAEPPAGIEAALASLARVPVAVVTGEASVFVPAGHSVADYLAEHGSAVTRIDLPALGIAGNGHGLFFEANSDETLAPVREWIAKLAS